MKHEKYLLIKKFVTNRFVGHRLVRTLEEANGQVVEGEKDAIAEVMIDIVGNALRVVIVVIEIGEGE